MMTLQYAIDGYLIDRTFLSEATLDEYKFWLNRFAGHLDEGILVSDIDSGAINGFFRWLSEDYVVTHQGPQKVTPRKLSPKSLKNAWISLSAFWKWMGKTIEIESPMEGLKGPKVYEHPISPYTSDQVKAMITSCDRSRAWTRDGAFAATTSSRPTAQRDKAIILCLLDSGVRATEFCNLDVSDLDRHSGALHVRLGKGKKSRYTYLGNEARRHLWRYLAQRFPVSETMPNEPLFVSREGRFTRTNLRRLLSRIGERSSISNVGVHRFRHTFAVMFLRNGGHELALQRLLGHSSLAMTKRYVSFTQEDIANAHRASSPSDHISFRK